MKLGVEWIGKTVDVRIDRPLGSAHPDHPSLIYPVNYGFLPDTKAADGEEIDAYVLGPDQPLTHFSGQVIALIRRDDDIEDKLVVAAESIHKQDITRQTEFQERFFQSRVITDQS
ncbi:MAG: inorganic diphosphatase [Rhodospirillales bacterium]|nr:inorganic diphosphatase [Rhodospirillales bacterium]MCB9996673.1 inorganic diphosphatase [Rhodospirillales bacterium]